MAQPIVFSEHPSQGDVVRLGSQSCQTQLRSTYHRRCCDAIEAVVLVEADYGSTGKWLYATHLDSMKSCFVIRLTAIPALPHDAMSSHQSGSRCENPASKVER